MTKARLGINSLECGLMFTKDGVAKAAAGKPVYKTDLLSVTVAASPAGAPLLACIDQAIERIDGRRGELAILATAENPKEGYRALAIVTAREASGSLPADASSAIKEARELILKEEKEKKTTKSDSENKRPNKPQTQWRQGKGGWGGSSTWGSPSVAAPSYQQWGNPPASASSGMPGGKGGGPKLCYRCNQPGHMANQCPSNVGP